MRRTWRLWQSTGAQNPQNEGNGNCYTQMHIATNGPGRS
jgi:hypothetical protein